MRFWADWATLAHGSLPHPAVVRDPAGIRLIQHHFRMVPHEPDTRRKTVDTRHLGS